MRRLGGMAGIAAWWIAATAAAQMNPELGEVGPPDQGMGGPAGAPMQGGMPMQGGAQMQGGWGQPPPVAPEPEYEAPQPPLVPGVDDHAAMAGHFGVGFFGVQNIPVMSCTNDPGCAGMNLDTTQAVAAPTIGIRYWLDQDLAIEGALGLGIASNSLETTAAGGTTPAPVESTTAFALHGGVPIALAHGGHFVFEVVPQLNFGIATGSLEDPASDTWDLSGMLVEVGARVGAEIHFGFIDIPQLALQGTLGLSLRLESRSAESTTAMTTHDQSTTSIGTSVGDEPWDVFTGGITAIYYFVD